jgi:phospholipid N-methyltransferase
MNNNRKILSLQKKIEKMKSSWLWNLPYTNKRQRQLDSYTYQIWELEKQIKELWWEITTDIWELELQQKIKAQLLKKIPWYFPTPKEVVKKMIELADIKKMDYILEPSAWTGAIIDWILEKEINVNILAIEYNNSNYEILKEKYNQKNIELINWNFLKQEKIWWFSKILMNPPFEKKQNVIHIMRAFELLNEWWVLIAIAWASVKFRNDYQEFRDFIDKYWYYEDIDQGAFKLSWTNVSTILIKLSK